MTSGSRERSYQGSCFCGAVHICVRGAPAAMGYCHCDSCRKWSAGPVNAFTLWQTQSVSVTRGAGHLASFSKNPTSKRMWCTQCGGHVLTEHPLWGVTDVYAASIPQFPFEAQLHVNYAETKLRVRDGLAKMKDMPAEMGGSGVVLPE